MSGFVLWLLYSFISPRICRTVQQQSVHIEWAYAYTGTWSQHHITKINVFIAVLARFLSTCLIENSELQSLSQMVWHCQARLLFLVHSPIYPVLWDLVCFCSPFQQHETSLRYFVILLLHKCSYICNKVLYGDGQTLKNYKPQSAYIFGRV